MARRYGLHALRRTRTPALDQRFAERIPSRLVADVGVGLTGIRAVERTDHLVDLVCNARRTRGRYRRLDVPQSDRFHALPHRLEACPQGPGLRHARHGLDHDRILVHRRRLLVAPGSSSETAFRTRSGWCNGTNTPASSAVRSGCWWSTSSSSRPGRSAAIRANGAPRLQP